MTTHGYGDAPVALIILTLVAACGTASSKDSSFNETASAAHVNAQQTNWTTTTLSPPQDSPLNKSASAAHVNAQQTNWTTTTLSPPQNSPLNKSASAAHVNAEQTNWTTTTLTPPQDSPLNKSASAAHVNAQQTNWTTTTLSPPQNSPLNKSASAAHVNAEQTNWTTTTLTPPQNSSFNKTAAAAHVNAEQTNWTTTTLTPQNLSFNKTAAVAHANPEQTNWTTTTLSPPQISSFNKNSAVAHANPEQTNWTTILSPPEPCELNMSIALPEAVLETDGSLSDAASGVNYPPGTFWLWSGEGDDSKPVHRGCPCSTGQKPCIRKCCLVGESISEMGDCVTVDNPFIFEVINVTSGEKYNASGIEEFVLLFGNPCRHGRYILNPTEYEEDEFYVDNQGYAILPLQNNSKHGPDSYCLDYSTDHEAYLPFMCFPPPTEPPENQGDNTLIYTMYPVGMLVSIPFLFMTFLVYAVIPELRNLHGKSLMCHVSSLVTAYMFLAVVQLGGTRLSDGVCITSAFIIEFSFLATFFWLNIMCIDIFLTFSGLRPLRGSLREREKKKFFIYSLYAWGCPLIILIVCITMDFAPGIPDSFLKPRFGTKKCWFSGKMETLVYFFGPMALLVLCNVILFVLTAAKLIDLKRETAMLKKGDSRRHDDREDRNRFNLYLKLLIVMGVNWVTELISWAVEGPSYLWYITDIGNTLQGFFIFLIFVWKRKIRALLLQRFFPAYDITSTGSWNPWRTSRAISPSKSSVSHGGSTAVTSLSVVSNNTSIRLQPLLKSPPSSPPAVP